MCLHLVVAVYFLVLNYHSECRSKRDMPKLYPHAKGILYALKDKGVAVAIASRSPTPDTANMFLEKLGIKSMFVAQVSYFSCISHIELNKSCSLWE